MNHKPPSRNHADRVRKVNKSRAVHGWFQGMFAALVVALVDISTPSSLLAQQLRVRLNWTEFAKDPARVAAFERAVEKMKNRSIVNPLDPLGWTYQANIHDTTDAVPADPIIKREWLGCRQAHHTWRFLIWHRGYLFYFEKILRTESGDDSLNLPYWSWDQPDQRALPAEFCDPQHHPQLFVPDGNRSAQMNQGASMNQVVDPANALTAQEFWPSQSTLGFSRRLEYPPHDTVHVFVGGQGGLMGSTSTAARDPIFWLHHCNIDRLWDEWLSDGNNHDPTDEQWLDSPFYFRDADGTPVEKRAQDVERSSDLGYTYIETPTLGVRNLLAAEPSVKASATPSTENENPIATVAKTLAASKTQTFVVTNKPTTTSLEPVDRAAATTLSNHAGELMAPLQTRPLLPKRTLALALAAAQPEGPSGAVYEVFLHRLGTEFDEKKAVSLGIVALFGQHEGHSAEFTFPLAQAFAALAKLGLTPTDPLAVTIVPVGLEKGGQPLPISEKAKIEISNLRIQQINSTQQ
jgi:hypothetical protein